MITLEFLVTSLIVVLIPGTGVVYTISTGLAQGRRASVYAAIGCTAGILPHLLATMLGLAAVMHSSALAFTALKYAGAAYLFYLALATWRDRSGFAVAGDPAERSARRLMVKALLLNILNPKLTLFFLAFLPQFVDPASPSASLPNSLNSLNSLNSPLAQMLVLSAIFMAMTFVVFVAYGFLAHAFRTAVIESPRVQAWLRRSFAAAFAGLGANLALADR